METIYTRLALLGPAGDTAAAGAAEPEPGSEGRGFFLPLAGPLDPGVHTVHWQTAGADGHVIRGSLTFTVEADSLAAPPPDPGAGATAAPPSDAPATPAPPLESPADTPLGVAIRWAHYLTLLGMIGAVAFRLGVVARMENDAPWHSVATVAAERGWWVAAGALALSVMGMVARLWMQSTALHGPADAWSGEHLATLLAATTWGKAWLLQAGAVAVFLAGLLLARRDPLRRSGWRVAAAAAVVLALVPALSGHAAAVERYTAVAVASDTLHVLGAGVWLGTLGLLLVAGLPAARHLTGGERSAAVAAFVTRFSPVALAGAGCLVATGILNGLFHFSAPAELWGTAYGRTLLLKLALFGFVVALGFYNWRVIRPSLRTGTTIHRLGRSAGFEIALSVAIVLVTAVLVVQPTP